MKWEYRVVIVGSYLNFGAMLNEQGQQGWELIYGDEECFVFKRQLPFEPAKPSRVQLDREVSQAYYRLYKAAAEAYREVYDFKNSVSLAKAIKQTEEILGIAPQDRAKL